MQTKAENLIYEHVFKTLVNDGFQQSHSEQAPASAIRLYRRNVRHKDAIKRSIAECKKSHKRTS